MQLTSAGYGNRDAGGIYLVAPVALGVGGCVLLTWGLSCVVKAEFRSWTPGANFLSWNGWRARLAGVGLCIVGLSLLALAPVARRNGR
jgi:hypothetical protein